MKIPVTVRIEADLLQAGRDQARQENRTLTNFIATVLQSTVVRSAPTRSILRAEHSPGPPDAP